MPGPAFPTQPPQASSSAAGLSAAQTLQALAANAQPLFPEYDSPYGGGGGAAAGASGGGTSTAPPDPHAPLSPAALDPDPLAGHPRYRKIKDLAGGSSGRVQLALNLETQEQVAIKYVARGKTFNAASIARELQNHRLCHNHPHIIQLREVFVTPKYLAVVMEWANGGDLAHFMAGQPRTQSSALPEDQARLFFQQLATAVDYSHRMGVANRDIKLDNILLHQHIVGGAPAAPVVKLCDFGFSKDEDDSSSKSGCGTPEYVAPEVLACPSYDGRHSDVWSCGVVLYVLLTGGFPFLLRSEEGGDQVAKMRAMYPRIMAGAFFPTQTSPACQHLLAGMLVPDPAERLPLAAVLRHPWFLHRLPPGYSALNAVLIERYPKEQSMLGQDSIVALKSLVRSCQRVEPSSDKKAAVFVGLDLSETGPNLKTRTERAQAGDAVQGQETDSAQPQQ